VKGAVQGDATIAASTPERKESAAGCGGRKPGKTLVFSGLFQVEKGQG
jgi:hypothetical protein